MIIDVLLILLNLDSAVVLSASFFDQGHQVVIMLVSWPKNGGGSLKRKT